MTATTIEPKMPAEALTRAPLGASEEELVVAVRVRVLVAGLERVLLREEREILATG